MFEADSELVGKAKHCQFWNSRMTKFAFVHFVRKCQAKRQKDKRQHGKFCRCIYAIFSVL